MKSSLAPLIKVIKRYSSFLITSHTTPDGDGIGSQYALASLLEKVGKKVVVVNDDPIPEGYNFLSRRWLTTEELDRSLEFEVVVVVECVSLDRVGEVSHLIPEDAVIVNIDHHPDNEGFGKINWVDTRASAVGEMIYELYRELDIPFGKEEALFLYLAIVTDTGSFRYANTTSTTHRVVAELISSGVKPAGVAEKLYEANSISATKLLAKVLSTIQLSEDGEIASLYVTRGMLAEAKVRPEEMEGFVNYARAIAGVKVALFFKETECEGEIKVSLRSKGPIDVNVLAQSFGGGGHPQAAGCTVKGKMNEVVPLVVGKAKEAIKSTPNQ